jgi:hypothetical protein
MTIGILLLKYTLMTYGWQGQLGEVGSQEVSSGLPLCPLTLDPISAIVPRRFNT